MQLSTQWIPGCKWESKVAVDLWLLFYSSCVDSEIKNTNKGKLVCRKCAVCISVNNTYEWSCK
ncbi:hypothetical protein E2C01_092679 [Portunus trituberculatus]|uniref:Uncharacterized protein n=1 Tax=Portunus trituberculatus TaxID=210409 RepID=A0A5B7JW32_PORTR|nr:hypothetical protein [Portunus trituberculatus]